MYSNITTSWPNGFVTHSNFSSHCIQELFLCKVDEDFNQFRTHSPPSPGRIPNYSQCGDLIHRLMSQERSKKSHCFQLGVECMAFWEVLWMLFEVNRRLVGEKPLIGSCNHELSRSSAVTVPTSTWDYTLYVFSYFVLESLQLGVRHSLTLLWFETNATSAYDSRLNVSALQSLCLYCLFTLLFYTVNNLVASITF